MKKKMLRRFLMVALLLGALTCVLSTGALAADIVKSGSTGISLKWTLDSDGVLTFQGEGEIGPHGYGYSIAPGIVIELILNL